MKKVASSSPFLPVAFCVAAILLTSMASMAQSPEMIKELWPIGRYDIVVDGSASSSARLFRSNRPTVYLVMGEPLSKPLILRPGDGKLETLDGEINVDPKGIVTVGTYTTSQAGTFTVGKTVDFEYDDHKISLRPKGYLLKDQTASTIQRYDPQYAWGAAAYQPDPALTQKIRNSGKDVTATVFFGSWCPHCQRYVPHIMKLQEQLAEGTIQWQYYGVDRGDAFAADPQVQANNIQKLPTVVLKSGGREIGRLVGRDCEKPEVKMAEIAGR